MTTGPEDEDSFQLRSPEGVALELPICGPGSRILAYAVDYIAILSIAIVIVIALSASLPILDSASDWFDEFAEKVQENPGDAQAMNAFLLPVFLITSFVFGFGELLYFTAWELATGGRSLGKIVVRLRVIERDGMPLTFRSSLIRNVLRIVDMLPSSYVLGLISILLSGRNQRLGDLASGTVVIRNDAYEAAIAVATDNSIEPLPLSRVQLDLLGAAELSLARGALRRSVNVSAERGDVLLGDAVEILRAKLMLDEQFGDDAKRFLERLVVTSEQKERRR